MQTHYRPLAHIFNSDLSPTRVSGTIRTTFFKMAYFDILEKYSNVCVLEYIVCMANINNLLFSISQYKSSQKVFHRFLYKHAISIDL